ncbi:MAG: hypothetical protein GWP91_25060 [Rhodobacterales bacterium]|nr:hypothetical protein [Rhodobacterales bacterium]
MHFLLAILASTALGALPAGETIDPAIAIDVTPDGFNAIESMVPAFIPSNLPLGDIGVYGSECWLIGGYDYGVEISNMTVNMNLNTIDMTPRDGGVIDILAVIDVDINDGANPFDLHTELICIGDNCDGYFDTFPVTITAELVILDDLDPYGNLVLDASIVNLVVDLGLQDDDLVLSGCAIGTIDDILSVFGTSLLSLIMPTIDSAIDGALQGAIDDLNVTLAETLSGVAGSLYIEDTLDITDESAVDILLAPTEFLVDHNGMRISMGGVMAATNPADCIAAFDPGTFRETPSDVPLSGEIPVAVGDAYDFSAVIADEFLNEAMFAIWRTGILCIELGGEGPPIIDLPIPVDSTLLGLLAPGVYNDFFEDTSPILIKTRPEYAPEVLMAPDQISLVVDGLGLEIYTPIDGREAKLLDVSLILDIALEPTFDTTLGTLDLGLELGGALSAQVNQNEFVPGTDAEVETGLSGLLDDPVISGIIGDSLTELAFGIPNLAMDTTGDGIANEKFGVQDLALTTGGVDDDWLGAYGWIGPVEYEYLGCTDSGCCGDSTGCEDSGCDTTEGCDTTGCTDTSSCDSVTYADSCTSGCNLTGAASGRVLAIAFAALVILRRRRED